MSNYLNNLVLRSLQMAPVVQPRPASTFETSLFSVGPAQGPTSADSSSEAQMPAPRVPAPLIPEVRTQIQVVHTQPQNIEVARSTIKSGDVRESQPADREKRARHLPIPESRSDVRSQNKIANTANIPLARTTPSVAKETIEIRSQARQVEPRIAGDTSNDGESLWRKFKPRVRSVVQDELSVLPAPQEDAISRPGTMQPPVAPAIVALRPEAISPVLQPQAVITSNPQPIATPAPEITVTIGRVDVRAVVTSSAPVIRSESRRTTNSSLDQYLKQRSEGRR